MAFVQLLRRCEACGGAFAVEYAWPEQRLGPLKDDLVQLRWLACPRERCRHVNPVITPVLIPEPRVKEVFAPRPDPADFRPHGIRLIRRGPAAETHDRRPAAAAIGPRPRKLARALAALRRAWDGLHLA